MLAQPRRDLAGEVGEVDEEDVDLVSSELSEEYLPAVPAARSIGAVVCWQESQQ